MYIKILELFRGLINTFPPCWLAVRSFYVEFLEGSLDGKKISNSSSNPLTKSDKLFDIIMDLLEDTLEKCSDEDLHLEMWPTVESAVVSTPPDKPTNGCTESADLSLDSEIQNQWEWEKEERRIQCFESLSIACRLERIFSILRILLQMLEYDFVMWILHHHKKTKDWIFCNDNRPLAVALFEMSEYTRISGVVRRVFTVFASMVNRRLPTKRLKVIEVSC